MSLAVRDDARLAGEVIRYHTWPHTRQQSVGEHSWQVCRILLAIAPEHCAVLLPHAIVHDIGEIGTGDVPYPVKANNPELGKMFDDLEHATADELCSMWMLPTPIRDWDKTLRWTFKLAEFIEMWEWGLEELHLGNEFARKVADRCLTVVDKMILDSQDLVISQRATLYVDTRQKMWSVK